MHSPTTLHWDAILKETYLYSYQSVPPRLEVYNEALNFRNAMCIKYGKHLLDSSCAKQSFIALSSGESEFYALVRGAGCGLQVSQILNFLGYDHKLSDPRPEEWPTAKEVAR